MLIIKMRKPIIFILPVFLTFVFCVPNQVLSQEEKSGLACLKISSVVASSFDDKSGKTEPMFAADGDLNTAWQAKSGLENQWICFDFGKPKTVSQMQISWAQSYAVDYELLVSNDGKNWHQLALLKNKDGDLDVFSFEPQIIRSIKILAWKCSHPKCGVSIREIEFWGPAKFNPQEKPKAKD